MNKENQRIFELDFLRGIALILMVLDHIVYDLYSLPFWMEKSSPMLLRLSGFAHAVLFSQQRLALHYLFATLFLLLAGIGSSLSRHPWRRVLRISGAAVFLTFVTVLLDLIFHLDCAILFGVLSAMAVGVLLCAIFSLFPHGTWISLVVGLALVAAGFALRWYRVPFTEQFYPEDFFSIALGSLRYGADWFPVCPCAGVICIGNFFGSLLYCKNRRSLIPALRGKSNFICTVGRYPLWIYLLHQPICIGLIYCIGLLFCR